MKAVMAREQAVWTERSTTLQEVAAWEAGWEALHARIAERFGRPEPRRRVWAYLKGLLSPVERKNGWQLAESAGDRTPDGLRRLLASYTWDAEAVRDDLRDHVVEHLGDPSAVWVVDETGVLKQGTHSVGVQRQSSGTAGRIENSQVGVFLTYRSPRGAACIDRALYLPEGWAQDAERRQGAGVPAAIQYQAEPLAAGRPEAAWVRLSAGEGAKGPRLYDGARVAIRPYSDPAKGYWLLVCRSLQDPAERADYVCFGPADTSLEELVRVAGCRWAIEQGFEGAQGEVGLDQYEVRRWVGWYRHLTLALLAHAFLEVTRTQAAPAVGEKGGPSAHPTSSR